jgi:Ser/Thr protein kinase RdoA (MazF antagonist)
MDVATLEAHIRWARPLTATDRQLLVRLQGRAALADMQPVIGHMLERGLKLAQEAVQWTGRAAANLAAPPPHPPETPLPSPPESPTR